MVGISIQSGQFCFNDAVVNGHSEKKALNVLVVGDFSGRDNQGLYEPDKILSQKQYRIDIDNFDDIFNQLNVQLTLPISDEPVVFREFDDLNPDHLYQNISLFSRFKSLSRKIKNPAQFDAAVKTLADDGLVVNMNTDESVAVEECDTPVPAGNLLDSLLSTHSSAPSETDIQALIRQTIRPYVQPKEDRKVSEYTTAIDEAVNDVMRQIMHASDFQRLEASWRSLALLNRRLDTDRACKLHILNVSKAEVLADLETVNDAIENSQLCQAIVARHTTAGSQPYDVIVVDYPLSGADDDIKLLAGLAEIAAQNGAIVLSGTRYEYIEKYLLDDKKHSDWAGFQSQQASKSTYIATPGFMLRLPYGRKTSSTETFNYEELPLDGAHAYYLWGNSAYLLLAVLVDAQQNAGMKDVNLTNKVVEQLPIHVFTEDGADTVKPCAEVYLTDKEVSKLEGLGLTPIQSIKGSDSVLIARWRSVTEC